MRLLCILIVGANLAGCACGVPLATGGTAEEPSFLLLSENKTLTSLIVACMDNGASWQTKWQLSGETPLKVIEYGKTPQGMRVLRQALPLPSLGLCALEARASNVKGNTCVSSTLFLVSAPSLTQCKTKHACEHALVEQISGTQGIPNQRLQDDRKRATLFCSLTSFGGA